MHAGVAVASAETSKSHRHRWLNKWMKKAESRTQVVLKTLAAKRDIVVAVRREESRLPALTEPQPVHAIRQEPQYITGRFSLSIEPPSGRMKTTAVRLAAQEEWSEAVNSYWPYEQKPTNTHRHKYLWAVEPIHEPLPTAARWTLVLPYDRADRIALMLFRSVAEGGLLSNSASNARITTRLGTPEGGLFELDLYVKPDKAGEALHSLQHMLYSAQFTKSLSGNIPNGGIAF